MATIARAKISFTSIEGQGHRKINKIPKKGPPFTQGLICINFDIFEVTYLCLLKVYGLVCSHMKATMQCASKIKKSSKKVEGQGQGHGKGEKHTFGHNR